MPIVDLVPLYEGLTQGRPALVVPDLFLAEPVPGSEQHRVAITTGNRPAVLIAEREDETADRRASPIRLEKLSVDWNRECRITNAHGANERGRYTVICCTDNDRDLIAYFLRVVSVLLTTIGPTPNAERIADGIGVLVELFRALAMPPRKSVQGLWAELFVISRGREPARLMAAWHARPDDLFDFADGSCAIEVKSAAGYNREHHFSLEQLRKREGMFVVVASLSVVRVGAGLSLAGLLERLRAVLSSSPPLLLKLESVVGATLGSGLGGALDDSFDEGLAASSLAFYAAEAIPCVANPVPPEISEVRFRVDLSTIPRLELSAYPANSLHGAVRGR